MDVIRYVGIKSNCYRISMKIAPSLSQYLLSFICFVCYHNKNYLQELELFNVKFVFSLFFIIHFFIILGETEKVVDIGGIAVNLGQIHEDENVEDLQVAVNFRVWLFFLRNSATINLFQFFSVIIVLHVCI